MLKAKQPIVAWGAACVASTLLLLPGLGCPADDGGLILTPPPPPPTTGAGGEAGAPSDGGNNFGGAGACDEEPCKLVAPQCGCVIGQRCVHAASERSCVPVGGKPAGAECANDCLAAHVCVNNGTGAPQMCHRYCLGDGDCIGDGSRCILELAGVPESLCTKDCDPLLQTGCVAAGTKCDIGTSTSGFTQCTGVGAGVQGDLCDTTSDCTAGLTCTSVNAGPNTCYTVCDVDNPTCPAQTACSPFNPSVTIGDTEYGICV